MVEEFKVPPPATLSAVTQLPQQGWQLAEFSNTIMPQSYEDTQSPHYYSVVLQLLTQPGYHASVLLSCQDSTRKGTLP